MRRLLVCGGRTFAAEVDGKPMALVLRERQFMREILHPLLIDRFDMDVAVITGGAPGADTYAEQIADELTLPIVRHKANWKRAGNAAGPMRNQLMLEEWKPTMIVAFPGGRGTADMIRRSTVAGIEVKRFEERGATA